MFVVVIGCEFSVTLYAGDLKKNVDWQFNARSSCAGIIRDFTLE